MAIPILSSESVRLRGASADFLLEPFNGGLKNFIIAAADNADSVIIAVCNPVHTCLLLYMDYSHSTITAGISQQLFHVFIFLFFGRKLFVYALFQRILDDKESLFVINKVTS